MNWCYTIKCVCFPFQNCLHGSREGLISYAKHGRSIENDWGLSPSIPNVLNQATTSLLAKETKSPSPTRFGCWIRTAEQHQLVMAATTSYGLRFGRANTSWKAYQVYFLMDPASCPYQLGFGRNCRFNTETFSIYGAASPCFGPMAHVSSWVQ